MEKNKIQGITFIALLLIGGLIWLSPHFKKQKPVSNAISEEYKFVGIKDLSVTEDFFKIQKRLEEKRPKLLWTRDPFKLQPKGSQKAEFGIDNLALSGIAVDETGKIAIINGEIVREGDVIFGIRIIKITEDTVTVEKEGKNYDLKIYY